jgi:short-subunit dehydrogenase
MSQHLALVTGASSGLGAEFARVLARRKINLVLVARRAEPMERLADELRERHKVEVLVQPMDLTSPGTAVALQKRLDELELVPDILVNNAAFGLSGRFVDQDPERIREMLQLDILSLVELTHTFARRMVERESGNILLVGSLAAHQPDPLLAAYGAAKSFVLSFGEALHVELAPKVGVTVVSPGLMETEFFQVSGYQPKESLKRSMIPASEVAEAGVKAMLSRKSSTVIGRLNKISAFTSGLLPKQFMAKLVYRMSREG